MKTRRRTVQQIDRRWLNEQIGKRLRALRKARGLTLADVAIELGVTRAAVNNWELGTAQSNFVLGTLYNIALFYKVPIAKLLP